MWMQTYGELQPFNTLSAKTNTQIDCQFPHQVIKDQDQGFQVQV